MKNPRIAFFALSGLLPLSGFKIESVVLNNETGKNKRGCKTAPFRELFS